MDWLQTHAIFGWAGDKLIETFATITPRSRIGEQRTHAPAARPAVSTSLA
jgi:hypothetical protein